MEYRKNGFSTDTGHYMTLSKLNELIHHLFFLTILPYVVTLFLYIYKYIHTYIGIIIFPYIIIHGGYALLKHVIGL